MSFLEVTWLRTAARTLLAGFVMGLANLIPGVSGGTMALLLGIYEDLIEALRALSDPVWLKTLAQGRWRAAMDALPLPFLLTTGCGMILAIFSLSHTLDWFYHHYPIPLEAFFFGLVAASMWLLARRIRRWGRQEAVGFLLGFGATWALLGLTPAHTPRTLPLLLLSMMLASAAMVLPGLSGAYVLMAMGQYRYALNAVTARDVITLALMVLSAGVGMLTLARVLDRFFKKQHDLTLAVLSGLVLASLRRLWPWKAHVPGVEELLQVNVLPSAWTSEVTIALVLALSGAALVVWLARLRP